MSGRHRGTLRRRVAGLHAPSMLGRVRADLGPLLVGSVVVAGTVLLAATVPDAVTRTADDAVRAVVAGAGSAAEVRVDVPYVEDAAVPRRVETTSARDVAELAQRVDAALPAALGDAVEPPVATVTTTGFGSTRAEGDVGSTVLRLAWLWRAGAPAVEWVEGGPAGPGVLVTPPPDPSAPGDPAAGDPAAQPDPTDPTAWRLEVALSEEVAAVLGVGVGDQVPARTPGFDELSITVSGVFRPQDAHDPVWTHALGVLAPRVSGSGLAERTEVTALLSDDALPAARMLAGVATTTRTLAFAPTVDALHDGDAATVGTALAGLQVAPTELGLPGGVRPSVRSELGDLLGRAEREVAAARAQASVLLLGVVTSAALALVVAAALVARRRASAVVQRRARGGSLAGAVAEATLESAALAGAATLGGLALARWIGPGRATWWVAPVVVVAVVAPPALAWRASALAAGGRRPPRDRQHHREGLRDRRLRRLVAEGAVLLAGVGGLLALRAQGVVPAAGPGDAPPGSAGGDLLAAAAPTLACAAAAVLLLRVLPAALRGAGRVAVRARGVVGVVASARARVAGTGPGVVVAVALASALAAVAVCLGATVRSGQEAGSWEAVVADVAVTTPEPSASLVATAASLAERPGVTLAVAARVQDGVQVRGEGFGRRVRVVVADPDALAALASRTPLPDDVAEPLTAGAPAGSGQDEDAGRPPALVGAELAALTERTGRLSVTWDGVGVGVRPAGAAPALGSGDAGAVVVDPAALARGGAQDLEPNTVWVVGPGAAEAVAAEPALAGAEVVARADWLADRRAAPLTAGLDRLIALTATALAALAVVVLALGAAAGSPERTVTLARLRTVGLGPRQARRVAAGELLPGALAAGVGGTLAGVAVLALTADALGLRLLTGQAGVPALVLPWWVLAVPVLAAATVLVAVAVEHRVARRSPLGVVLRVGGP